MWAKTANKCKNCATNLYSHKAKGLCTKCYRVFRELEKIDKLESTDKDAFEILYTFIPFTIHAELKQKDIAQQKEKLKKAVKDRRLRYIELYGAIESGALDMNILRLEDVFNEI